MTYSSIWRDIVGLEEFFAINEAGQVLRKSRVDIDGKGRAKRYQEAILNKQPTGDGYHLKARGFGRAVSTSTLLRENFPELNYKVESFIGEDWRSVPGFEWYSASNLGRIKRAERNQWNGFGHFVLPEALLVQSENADGYLTVTLNDGEKQRYIFAHRVVAMAFHGERPDGFEVNHKDFVRTNNNPTNLEWVTHAYNVKYSKDAGRYKESV